MAKTKRMLVCNVQLELEVQRLVISANNAGQNARSVCLQATTIRALNAWFKQSVRSTCSRIDVCWRASALRTKGTL